MTAPPGPEGVDAGLDGNRPAALDHDPVNPAAGVITPPAWRMASARAALTAPLPPSATGMATRSPRCMISA